MVGARLCRYLQGVVIGELTVRRPVYIAYVRKLRAVLPARRFGSGIGLATVRR